ncbi:ABC transporter ATP-binding protein [Rubellicoccus peritrichatus]|uniref:ATP-binding cassette domain-containing protein n=1 Tax=Rubellicoccus peritrichatus TaxID=3080537 RepID=A0AAQ3LCK3_9BACT|nr:ATP-binding cassette domain-containing protein [Puniceicoccus sp. CR14]WOO43574.1 ATP-binding cassette domain-containing protein [Puniceicoccus sp. CR14]
MLSLNKLTKKYGQKTVVDSLNLELESGEILGFLGPNGAGKSTTMKMITGFLLPTSGSASINGFNAIDSPVELKRLIGYLPERGPLYEEMTILEFLKFSGGVRGLLKTELARGLERVLDACELSDVRHQVVGTLSKGYRQRVGMAQAIIHDPPCLILDEPTDGLDPNQKREMRRLIAGMSSKGIIVSTHILEEVEAVCNRVVILDKGRIVANETPESLMQFHEKYRVICLKANPDNLLEIKTFIEEKQYVARVVTDADGLNIYPDQKKDIEQALWQDLRQTSWGIHSLSPIVIRMDDVFESLTQ